MNPKYEKIKNLTIDELFNTFLNVTGLDEDLESKSQKIYQCIFNKESVDYKSLYALFPTLDSDDISMILKYDRDYKISFLLSLVDIADEDDLTRQAIYLLRRHNLNHILPLIPYVNEEEIREEYAKLNKNFL